MIESDAPADSEFAIFLILGNRRPGQKVPGLSFQGAVHRHWSAQGRTVKLHFYLGAMRRVHDAVRRNDQEISGICVFISLHTRGLGPTCAVDVGSWCAIHKTPHTQPYASFYCFLP